MEPKKTADEGLPASPSGAAPGGTASRRVYARKALRGSATVILPDNVEREATMSDLGLDGLCIVVAKPMSPGLRCTVSFDVPAASGATRVTVAVKVVHCSFLGVQRFRVGIRFVDLDAPTAAVLAQFTP